MVFVSGYTCNFEILEIYVISCGPGTASGRYAHELSICTLTDSQCDTAHDWTHSFPHSK